MPIVNRETIYFRRSDGTSQFKRVISVNAGGQFSTALPEEVYTALGLSPEIRGDTRVGVIKKFDQVLADYKNSKTIVQRVILYSVSASAYIWDEVAGRCIYNMNDVHFSKGTTLAVWAAVYDEYETTKADGTKSYEYKGVKSSIPQGPTGESDKPGYGDRADRMLPWTEQREAFFTYIIKSMQTLILRLAEITKDTDTLLGFMDSGRLLGTVTEGKDAEIEEA